MATVYTDSQNYTDIANAIREKNGTTDNYLPSEMAAAITAIPVNPSTDDANAIAADIRLDKTAYVKGKKVEGTMPTLTIMSFTSTNVSKIGANINVVGTIKNIGYSSGGASGRAEFLANILGDSTADKVVKGSTFSSENGVAVAGTMENADEISY